MDRSNESVIRYLFAAVRFVLGWIFIWAFFDKMFGLGFETPAGQGLIDGVSPSAPAVYITKGIFSGMFDVLAGTPFADFMMMAGLICVGIGLVTGMARTLTTIAGSLFLLMMYMMTVPPVDNPLFDYHITWILFLWIIYLADGYSGYSLSSWWCSLPVIRDYRILQ